MFILLLTILYFVSAGDPLWSQRGKDWSSSSRVDLKTKTRNNWKRQFGNKSVRIEPEASSEILIDPETQELHFLCSIGYDFEIHLFTLDLDTGKVLRDVKLTDIDSNKYDMKPVTPLLDSSGNYIFILPTYRLTNGTYKSILYIIDKEKGLPQKVWVNGQFTGSISLYEDTLIFLAKSPNPYYRFFDIVGVDLAAKDGPKEIWRVSNAFVEDDVHSMDMMMIDSNGYFYVKNRTFGSIPPSFYQKFAANDEGSGIATQSPPISTRIFDSKPIFSVKYNRVCFTSHIPFDLDSQYDSSKQQQNDWNPSQRYITCLDADTLEVIFDNTLNPRETGVAHWYDYNPSLSQDEEEMYIVNGFMGISPTPTTSLFVVDTNSGEVVTKYDLSHSCLSHDVPFAVFGVESKYRFAIICIDDDKNEAYMYIMDRTSEGNVKKLDIGTTGWASGVQNIQVVVDTNDCVYYCWYEELGEFPDYYDISFCGRTCV